MKNKYNYLKHKIRHSKSARYVALAVIPAVVFASVGVTYAFGGGMPPGGPGGDLGMGTEVYLTADQLAANQEAQFQAEAKLLNLNVSAIVAGWAQGETLEQIATANGITASDLQNLLKTDRQQKLQGELDALVSQGVITQDQATARLQTIQSEQTVSSTMGAFGGHVRRGPGGPGRHASSTTSVSAS